MRELGFYFKIKEFSFSKEFLLFVLVTCSPEVPTDREKKCTFLWHDMVHIIEARGFTQVIMTRRVNFIINNFRYFVYNLACI